MSIRSKGEHRYGDSQADIREELLGYSAANAYLSEHFADAVCSCGARVFGLRLDDAEGAAVRICRRCKAEHPIGDSAEFLDEAALEDCECPCGRADFEITAGVALERSS